MAMDIAIQVFSTEVILVFKGPAELEWMELKRKKEILPLTEVLLNKLM